MNLRVELKKLAKRVEALEQKVAELASKPEPEKVVMRSARSRKSESDA